MQTTQAISALPTHNTLGECVIWDHHCERVLWTDIEERMLYSLVPQTGQQARWNLPKRLASFALTAQPDTLVCAFEDELALWQLPKGRRETLFRLQQRHVRFNDGRADAQGNFWVGTMVENETSGAAGALYRLDPDGKCQLVYQPISIANSICWDRARDTMYFSDSRQQQIWRVASHRRVPLQPEPFIKLSAGEPDGATVDSAGNLWVACWGTGAVHCYGPQGALLETVAVAASQPSCVTFGGPALDQLFITSARVGLAQPASADGNLFMARTAHRGLPENYYGTVQPTC